jgi:hypothetical protein
MVHRIKREPPARPPTYNELRNMLEAILWSSDTTVQGEMLSNFRKAEELLYGKEIDQQPMLRIYPPKEFPPA